MENPKKDQTENFDQWKDKILKSMNDVYLSTDPLVLAVKEAEKEAKENARLEAEERREKIENQILFFVIMVLLIPALVFIWNIHPVLGILGIVGYVWLVKNKLQTGYYFGY